jgi:O-antigen/teichoic acid export membrane protein
MVAIFGIGFAIHSICLTINVIFQAQGKLYLASINGFVVFGGHAVIGLIILFLGGRLIALSTAYLAASIIGFALNVILFPRTVHAFRIKRHDHWKEHVRESVPVGLGALFHSLTSRSVIALLLFISGPLETGIYSAASRIPFVLRNVPFAFLAAVIPVMAAHQDRADTVRRLFRKSSLIMLAMAVPLTIVFFVFARPIVLLLYGEQYEASIMNLRILCWTIIPMFTGIAFGHVVLSQDHLVKVVPWVNGIGLATVLTSGLILIPRLGGEGAAYSALITFSVIAVGYFLATRKFLFQRLNEK